MTWRLTRSLPGNAARRLLQGVALLAVLLLELAGCGEPVPPELVLPPLAAGDYRWIAERIGHNETGGQERYLTHWGAGEDFPSLGIGHFIWFPAGVDAPFDESFPALIEFLAERSGPDCPPVPAWLVGLAPLAAPWPGKETFDRALDSPEMVELRRWLACTAPMQAEFIVTNFVNRWNELTEPGKDELTALLERLVETPEGLFAVIDYVNFKGLGNNPRERYGGEGWGLLQVLADLAATSAPPDAVDVAADNSDDSSALVGRFSDAAAGRLTRRVLMSPPGRNEARWLPGWLRRVAAYKEPYHTAADEGAENARQ